MKNIGKISAITLALLAFAFPAFKADAKVMDASEILSLTADEVKMSDGTTMMIPVDVYVLGNHAFYNSYSTSDVIAAMNEYMMSTPAEEIEPLTLYSISAEPYLIGETPVVKIENALKSDAEEIDETQFEVNITKVCNFAKASEVAKETEGATAEKDENNKTTILSYNVTYVAVLDANGGFYNTSFNVEQEIYNEYLEDPENSVYFECHEVPAEEETEYVCTSKIANVELYYDDNIGSDYEPMRIGYDFAGWNTKADGTGEDVTSITKDITLYAKWVLNEAPIVFSNVSEDDVLASDETVSALDYIKDFKSVTLESPKLELEDLADREDASFGGWFVRINMFGMDIDVSLEDAQIDDETGEFVPGSLYGYTIMAALMDETIEPSLEIYAKWIPAEVTVSFEAGSGLFSPAPIVGKPGNVITLPVKDDLTIGAEKKVGYDLVWTKKINFMGYEEYAIVEKEEIDENTTDYVFPDEDITYYAKWSPISVSVTFDANGGNFGKDENGTPRATYQLDETYDMVLETPSEPDRTGYTFAGWFTDPECSEAAPTLFNSTTSVTYYAKWEVKTFDVVLHANYNQVGYDNPVDEDGEEILATDTFEYETAKNLISVADTGFSLTGYSFVEWNTKADGTGLSFKYDNDGKLSFTLADNADLVKDYTDENDKINLYAIWKADIVTLTFHTGSGKMSISDSIQVTYDTKYSEYELPNLYDPAYNIGITDTEFAYSWYLDNKFTIPVEDDTLVKTATAHKLYAKWMGKAYSVTFDAGEGKFEDGVENVLEARYGDKYAFPSKNPTRYGYDFAGWNTKADGTGTVVNANTVVEIEEAQTLYAQWAAKKVNVTFDAGTGASYNTIQVQQTFGKNYELPTAPTKVGYDFGGWFTETNGNGSEISNTQVINTEIANDTIYYAKWTSKKVNAVFNANGGDFGKNADDVTVTVTDCTVSLTFGADVVLPTVEPTRIGYTFGGWNTKADGTGDAVTVETVVNFEETTTFYAVWDVKTPKATFDANGGNFGVDAEETPITSKNVNQEFGTTYNLPVEPTRTGYTFAGWYLTSDAEFENKVTNETNFTSEEDVTLVANWTANKYAVTFDANGGAFAEEVENVIDETYDAKYTLPTKNPTRAGYVFAGWYLANDEVTSETVVKVTDTATVKASWTAMQYSVIYHFGEETKTQTLTFDDLEDVKLNANAWTKTGYTFAGWNTKADGTGTAYENEAEVTENLSADASNVNLYAQWTAKTYNVKFYRNTSSEDETSATQTLTFDNFEDVKLNANAWTNVGYTFAGWNTKADGTGTAYENEAEVTENLSADATDVELYAIWTPATDTAYKVEHYFQDVNSEDTTKPASTYTPDETKNVIKEGTTGELTSTEAITVEGFTVDASKTSEVEIAGDGSTVVKYYYNRNKVTITLSGAAGYTNPEYDEFDVYYGCTYPSVNALGQTASRTGYDFGYYTDGGVKISAGDVVTYTGGIIALTGKFTPAEGYAFATSSLPTAPAYTVAGLNSYLASATAPVSAKMIQNATGNIVVPADKSLTLDLAGYTLTGTDSTDTIIVEIGGTLVVNDSSADKTGKVLADVNSSSVFNNGSTTLNAGTYTKIDQTDKTFYVITNHGVMTVESSVYVHYDAIYDGSSHASLFENGYSSYNSANSRNGYVEGVNNAAPSLTINGGTYQGGLNTIKNDDGATLVINDGTFENFIQVAVLNWNVATINGGTFKVTSGNDETAIANAGSSSVEDGINQGILTINGGIFKSTYAIKARGNENYEGVAKITVNAGDFTSEELTALISPDGIANLISDKKLEINGGTYKGSSEAISGLSKADFDSLLGTGAAGALVDSIYTVSK